MYASSDVEKYICGGPIAYLNIHVVVAYTRKFRRAHPRPLGEVRISKHHKPLPHWTNIPADLFLSLVHLSVTMSSNPIPVFVKASRSS